MVQTNHFINNKFVPSISGKTFEVFNPTTEKLVANVQAAQSEDVDAAVDAASNALPGWTNTHPSQRADLLRKLSALIKRDTEILGKLESSCMGCPTGLYPVTIGRTCAALEHCAALGQTQLGQSSHQGTPGFFNVCIKQPYGVVAAIIPWNVSILLLAFKVGPAVAAGNTIVLKSSEKSPLSSLHVAELVKEAGFPPGVINIISGLGPDAGQALAEHMRIRKISFTGSHFTGKKVAVAAAQSNLKRVTLELGGKGPSVVFEDADVERAAKSCAASITRNTGQICSANTRVYVHESIYEQFAKIYLETYLELAKHGDPVEDAKSTQGPLVDAIQFKRVMEYIETGKKEGQLLTGGNRKFDKGYFVEPTVFTKVDDNAKINKEEIFGPVSIIHTFKTEEEALRRANDTEYGLTSSVYTRDMERALRVSKALETGQVCVNSPNQIAPEPYGGWKVSGTGREMGSNALDPFLQEKVIYMPCP